jgi:glutamine amidotransferase
MITSPQDVRSAGILVLPGVGSFGEGMAAIHRLGLQTVLEEHARGQKPLLGICLGMQMLLDAGYESGFVPGLGLVPGEVRRLEKKLPGQRIPNMGWCEVRVRNTNIRFFPPRPQAFYFLHGYECRCKDETNLLATIDLGYPVAAAIGKENVYGVQFHPEKSQDAGLDFLERFIREV